MLRLNKNKNILYTLRDRELNISSSPQRLSINLLRRLIESEDSHYSCDWAKNSPKPITYEADILFFNNQTECYTIYGSKRQPSYAYTLKPSQAKRKVGDFIIYSSPVLNRSVQCVCRSLPCACYSKSILYVTDDNYLCWSNLDNGRMLQEVFVKRNDTNYRFKYCDWDIYGERIVLTTTQNPTRNPNDPSSFLNQDVVVNLAVFRVFPFEFVALLEIKRSIFGWSCKHVNANGQLLLLGMGSDQVHIYSFLDVLNEGFETPFKLGDNYMNGEIGKFPTGIPLNCHIERKPPLLFNVQCNGQSLDFGATPYHCIYSSSTHLGFNIESLKVGLNSESCFIASNLWQEEPDAAYFHPDSSNRILAREPHEVRCFEMVYSQNNLELKLSFKMGFESSAPQSVPAEFSSFGRKLKRTANMTNPLEKCVLAVDFDDELQLLGVLGYRAGDPESQGFVKLFDSLTGREVKCVELKRTLNDSNYYMFYVHLDVLILIEKDEKHNFSAYVYTLHSTAALKN